MILTEYSDCADVSDALAMTRTWRLFLALDSLPTRSTLSQDGFKDEAFSANGQQLLVISSAIERRRLSMVLLSVYLAPLLPWHTRLCGERLLSRAYSRGSMTRVIPGKVIQYYMAQIGLCLHVKLLIFML